VQATWTGLSNKDKRPYEIKGILILDPRSFNDDGKNIAGTYEELHYTGTKETKIIFKCHELEENPMDL
jgi:hypothetical protein